MSLEVEGDEQVWTERRLVVRSLRHAQAAEAALRARVAQAQAQVEALNVRGRGRKRYEDIETLRQAAHAIVQGHRVAEFLWLRYDQHSHDASAACLPRSASATGGRSPSDG